MSDTNIRYPENSSAFEVKFATNEKELIEVQNNISFTPTTIGEITGIALSNNGFSLIGTFNAFSDIETSANLIYSETGGLTEQVSFVLNTTEGVFSNICFYENAKVLTDNGYKEIKDISKGMKIHGKKIEEVTQTCTEEKNIVLMKAGCIMKNMPFEDTRVTKEHKILYKGKMIESKKLVNGKSIVYEKYNGNILYNILLEGDEEGKMIVNGMIVETLSPKNNIAKLYKILKQFETREEKREIIKIFNEEKGIIKYKK